MTTVKRVVTRPYEGTYSEIQRAASKYAEKFATVFGATSVDIQYGTFTFKSERVFTREEGKVSDVVFKVNMKFVANVEVTA